MIDERLRRRLELLNRGPLPASESKPAGDGNATVHDAGWIEVRQTVRSTTTNTLGQITTSPQKIPGLLRSGEIVETAYGQHLRIRLPLESVWQGGTKMVLGRQAYLHSHFSNARGAIEPAVVIDPEFAKLITALPDRAVALDLETCGLAGSALFLVGLFRQIDTLPTVELLLARNYSEEGAVLDSLWKTIADCNVLLTFNGKTFDWPMVIERSTRHRLPVDVNSSRFTHIDILHHARRRWRKQLPNCRLQTLEWHVCRRRRTADIPGHCIPAVYADYVRTGFERDIDTVLHHNALDLVTLFDLALRLAA
jgi:uncharacterized protein YprB with RNaseH-like and TPR domain